GAADRAALVEAEVVTVGADGRCEPRHDLLAEAAIASIDERRRRHLHRVAAMASADAAGPAAPPATPDQHAPAGGAAPGAGAHPPSVSSRADFLMIVAEHTCPPSTEADLAAAEALSLAGRYREAVEVLDRRDREPSPAAAHELLVRARA